MVAPRDTWLNSSSSTSGIEASVFLSTSNWDAENLGYSLNYNGQELWYPLGGLRNRKTGNFRMRRNPVTIGKVQPSHPMGQMQVT